eukprot:CAMPEP_0197583110 /NCGR_PEP_ID=MMETSP1326-20131121/6129_1 /TAXON_ID=1155430 /ORGANISM="Genus nov. species nov., Strain RCC2288" /LENGTH=253 /DNA_ID=CAMNT_0043147285 /DNA_START=524 /DNA_END=1281 /DNA_ORIENTATION=+
MITALRARRSLLRSLCTRQASPAVVSRRGITIAEERPCSSSSPSSPSSSSAPRWSRPAPSSPGALVPFVSDAEDGSPARSRGGDYSGEDSDARRSFPREAATAVERRGTMLLQDEAEHNVSSDGGSWLLQDALLLQQPAAIDIGVSGGGGGRITTAAPGFAGFAASGLMSWARGRGGGRGGRGGGGFSGVPDGVIIRQYHNSLFGRWSLLRESTGLPSTTGGCGGGKMATAPSRLMATQSSGQGRGGGGGRGG